MTIILWEKYVARHLRSIDPVVAFHLYPLALVDLLRTSGARLDALLEDTGITDDIMADHNASISYVQYGLLIRNALRHYAHPGLGLRFGATLHVGHQGMLGVASMTSNTLRDAGLLAERFYKFLSPVLVLEMRIEGDECVVQANEAWDLGPLRIFGVECLFVGLMRHMEFVLGIEHFPCRFDFGYPAPAYVALYDSYLKNPVNFDRGFHQMRFDAKWLDASLRFRHPLTCQQATAICEDGIGNLPSRESVLMKLRQLPVVAPGRVLSLEEAATALHMSDRTLKRQLQKLNTQYRRVVDAMRFEWAASALRSTDMAVADIAEQMCFTDVANFRRAFKRWTSQTPQEYRYGREGDV